MSALLKSSNMKLNADKTWNASLYITLGSILVKSSFICHNWCFVISIKLEEFHEVRVLLHWWEMKFLCIFPIPPWISRKNSTWKTIARCNDKDSYVEGAIKSSKKDHELTWVRQNQPALVELCDMTTIELWSYLFLSDKNTSNLASSDCS